jgi:hypothetical protein
MVEFWKYPRVSGSMQPCSARYCQSAVEPGLTPKSWDISIQYSRSYMFLLRHTLLHTVVAKDLSEGTEEGRKVNVVELSGLLKKEERKKRRKLLGQRIGQKWGSVAGLR